MKPKLISIVGPTSSGKTSLSIAIAKRFNGEVISADSRQVYRGLDLGTGKVTPEEMNGVPHHLLDIADPMDVYTAADFKRDAEVAIADIVGRGKLPIIAGGTFFYIDALLGKIQTPEVPPNPELRETLEQKSAEELFQMLEEKDPSRAETIDPQNPRRLVRALEIVETIGKVPPPSAAANPYETLTIGIDISKEQLHHSIHVRLLERIDQGMIEEVQKLHEAGMTHERMESLGLEYRYIARYLQGQITKEAMLEELETKIRQFAKRQMTWLKRDDSIQWFAKDDEKVFGVVERFLRIKVNQ